MSNVGTFPAAGSAGAELDAVIDITDGALAAHAIRAREEAARIGGGLRRLPSAVVSAALPWQRGYRMALVGLDVLAILVGCAVAVTLRFGDLDADVQGISYPVVTAFAVLPWVLTIAACRGYEARFFGLGSEEFRRVGNAGIRFTALVAVIAFSLKLDLARGLVAVALPVSCSLALVFRYSARQWLHRHRADGRAGHRVLVVGEAGAAQLLASKLRENPHAGLQVVGTCRPVRRETPAVSEGAARAAAAGDPGAGPGPEVSLTRVGELARGVGADTVAVAHSPGITSEVLRRMSWNLEGAGVDLLVAPAFTDVAGPRIHVRPVSGLPLLQIAAPEFTGVRRLAKGAFDWFGALALTVLLLPVMVTVAVAVALDSRGPILFRQTRVGKDGTTFTMFKFRSMCVDAEKRRADLEQLNEHDGVLFKIKDDPRVTRVGRHLRRLSLDELPQLLNVLLGQMSLVGPRPPLPAEVANYASEVHRRLLVKPGLTGLWQVSGRADLSWEEAVRLDLYYVENWSVALDAEILWKTAFAVLGRSGAH